VDGKTLIDDVLRDHHGLDPDDAEYADNRLRIKRNGQRAINHTWLFKNWTIRYVSAGTVTVSGGAYSALLPADFNSLGKYGSVVVPAIARELDWMPLGQILRLINGDPRVDSPTEYSVGKIDTGTPTAADVGKQSIFIYPTQSSSTVLVFPYERKPPVLLDAVAPSGLEEIPESYHETVIKEGTIAFEMRDDGDGRFAEQYALFRSGLITMARDMPAGLEAPRMWPVYPGARRHYARLGFRSR
jgi:hypothetical protein